jgi:hypothetical protein
MRFSHKLDDLMQQELASDACRSRKKLSAGSSQIHENTAATLAWRAQVT